MIVTRKAINTFFILTAMYLLMPALQAQDKLMLTEQNGLFKEVYWVNASDKLIKDGKSTTYYKGKVIEQGTIFR